MSDNPQVAPPAPIQPAQVQPTATTPAQTTGGKTFTESEVEQIIKDRLGRETAKREQAIKEAAAKAEAEAAAKNGEWEKLAKANEAKLNETLSMLKAKELVELKRTIAEKVGIPLTLAARLMGDTTEAIEADAKALLETLPKQQKPQPGPVANPGANGQQAAGETNQQALARLHGQGTGAWDISMLKSKGGGGG